jgi:hypothetical protein
MLLYVHQIVIRLSLDGHQIVIIEVLALLGMNCIILFNQWISFEQSDRLRHIEG